MIKQTKKKVFALLGIAGLIGILSIPTVTQTPSIPEQNTQSKVAEQKSVIEEQAIMLPYAGVSFALGNNGALKLNTPIMDVNNIPKVGAPYTVVESKTTEEEPVEEIFYNGWTNARVNVRTEPNTDCSVITTVSTGEELEFVEIMDGWVKVAIDSDEGYVSSEFVEVKDVLPRALTMTEARYGIGVSDVRVALVDFACQFVGNPYVWGGTSLTKGADCSGFVLSVFKEYGYTLPHHSGSQAQSGTKISESELLPGDLVFYSNGSRINHVAIYIGGGQVVHASNPKTGIRISSYKYRTPVKYVRIIND